MKALIQRVSEAKVFVDGNISGAISKGMLVFLGVERGDNDTDIDYLVRKVSNLRIFEDANKKLNLSLLDIQGEALVVSQFTLAADCRKGNRPSFESAEEPSRAQGMYRKFIERLSGNGLTVATGDFGAFMQVHLINDGPVTILIDPKGKAESATSSC
jgi:D-tyrosyl-tRNA(Tyr) deacylase